jgi:hypothetical protein
VVSGEQLGQQSGDAANCLGLSAPWTPDPVASGQAELLSGFVRDRVAAGEAGRAGPS